MSCIFEWDGYYYEYSSFQLEPYEVNIVNYEDLWHLYQDRKSTLSNLMDYIGDYNSTGKTLEQKKYLKELVDMAFSHLEYFDRKIKELKNKYNIICNDSPKIVPLNDPNLTKKVLQYKFICKNCDTVFDIDEKNRLSNEDAIKNLDYKKMYVCTNCGGNDFTEGLANIYFIEKYYNKAKESFINNRIADGIEYGEKCIELYDEIDDLYDKEKIDKLQYTMSTVFRFVACGYSDLNNKNESYRIADKGIKELEKLKTYNRRIISNDLLWLHFMRLFNVTKNNSKSKENVIIDDCNKVIEYIFKTEEEIKEDIEGGYATETDLDEFKKVKDEYIIQAYYYGAVAVGEIFNDIDVAEIFAKKGYDHLRYKNIDHYFKNEWESIYNNLFSLIESIKIERQQQDKSKGCYIATAVYNSYDCPQVWTLRRFRDYYLMNRMLGKLFVRVYYLISPKIVQMFGEKKWFNKIFRVILNKFIINLKNRGYADTVYEDN